MPKPKFVRCGNAYLNFDLIARAQAGKNMRGQQTVKLYACDNREIAEVLEEAFLQAVEIVNREAA